jgi:predicted RecB family nuclease
MGDDVFLSYLYCKYKGYLTLKGKKGELSEYGRLQAKLRQRYRDAATSAIICNNRQSFIPENPPLSIGALKQGAPLIVNAAIKHKSIRCEFDALKRVDGKSLLGSFYYVPVVFSEHNTIGKQQELLLSLGSLILSDVQKISSDIGIVIFGPEYNSRTLHLKKHHRQIQQLVDEIVDVRNNSTVPKLILNKNCRVCQYEKRCLDQAKSEGNLSLIGTGENDNKQPCSKLQGIKTQKAVTV